MPFVSFKQLSLAHRKVRLVPIGVVVTLLLGFALYRGVVLGQEKQEKAEPARAAGKSKAHASPPVNPEKPGADSSESKVEVSLTGHLSRDSAGPSGKIRFWITISNQSEAPIQNLRFADFFVPGFSRPEEFSGGCNGATWGQVCSELAPQATVTIWGDLSAGENSEPKENAYAVVLWDSKTRPAQAAAVQLGEIERLSWWEALWKWLTQLDVGLPTLTALLIGVYKLRQGKKEKRETAQKAAEASAEAAKKSEQERKERSEAELREQHQQTWNLMLPQANRFSLKYYIPSANAIVTSAAHLALCRTSTATPSGANDPELHSALFDLVQLQWHRLRMKHAIGGYYFKSRTAESVTEGLFQKHRVHFKVTAPQRFIVLSKFVKPLTRTYDVGDFVAGSANWDADQKQFFVDFKTWVKSVDCEKDLIVLGAMSKVLWYESNRPFLNWYQEQPPIVLTDDEKKEIEAVGEEGKSEDASMPRRVTEYISEITTGVPAAPQP